MHFKQGTSYTHKYQNLKEVPELDPSNQSGFQGKIQSLLVEHVLESYLRLGVWLKWEMTGTKNFLFLFYMIQLISELFQAI